MSTSVPNTASTSAETDATTMAVEAIRQMPAIRLVVSEEMAPARAWAPYGLMPSTVMLRAQFPVTEEDLEPKAAPSGDDTPEIVLDRYLGHHPYEDYDSYLATLHSSSGDTGGLIVKMIDLVQRIGPKSRCAAWVNHIGAPYEVAAHLQGTALPRFAGVFGRGTTFCLIFEDAGPVLTDEELDEPSVWQEMDTIMDQLYAVDVYPSILGCQQRSAWTRGRDGRVKLAYFTDCTTAPATDILRRDALATSKMLMDERRDELQAP